MSTVSSSFQIHDTRYPSSRFDVPTGWQLETRNDAFDGDVRRRDAPGRVRGGSNHSRLQFRGRVEERSRSAATVAAGQTVQAGSMQFGRSNRDVLSCRGIGEWSSIMLAQGIQ